MNCNNDDDLKPIQLFLFFYIKHIYKCVLNNVSGTLELVIFLVMPNS